MRVSEITAIDELEAARPDWTALWERCPHAGPFQHPDWLLPWWRHLGGSQLLAVAIHDGSDLQALAPFFIHARQHDGARQLTLLGNGVSDRLDVLIAGGKPIASALFAYLDQAAHWDTCDFRDLPPGSVLLDYAAHTPTARLTDDAPSPVLPLDGAAPDLAGTVSSALLSRLRHSARRADALGPLRIERADTCSCSASLDALFALHAARWSPRHQPGVLAQPAIEAFHREVAQRFLRRGWLRLYVLRVGSALAGVNYGFHVRDRAYAYISGFNPDFAKISPGLLILRHAISDAVRGGAQEFDFLRGAESHKYRWGARDRPQYRVQIDAPAPQATEERKRPSAEASSAVDV